jgi:CheY-like chemotaxis protein
VRLFINGIYGIIIITEVAASDRLVSLLKTVHRSFVDNDAENLWSLRIALVGGGHRVMVAADAGRALAILRHEAVEIMITDYQMPGIDGVQLCEMTRSQPAHSSLPIVLQSAATEPAYAPRVWTHFLRRPASIVN